LAEPSAKHCWTKGADVCFADIDGDKVAEVAASNSAHSDAEGGKVTHAAVDVTDRMQVRAMIAHAVSVFGKIDVKFNNAGVNKPMNFLDVTEENWNFIMGVNGLGCMIGMQEAARQMIAQGTGGKIVNTASVASAARASTTSHPIARASSRLYP
jgi:meso-butanediol dehydrogenase/(S,S)-butanediol dehydrogenase/diacetyl reductase